MPELLRKIMHIYVSSVCSRPTTAVGADVIFASWT